MNVQDPNFVVMQLGKNGINDNLVSMIKKELSKNKLVKLKLLKSALESSSRKVLSDELRVALGDFSFEFKLVGNVLFLKRLKLN